MSEKPPPKPVAAPFNWIAFGIGAVLMNITFVFAWRGLVKKPIASEALRATLPALAGYRTSPIPGATILR